MASLDYELDNRKNHLELKTDAEYCIGRDPGCAVCLGEMAKVSRRHCVIYFNTTINSFALADLYSTNGTDLNGRKIGHLDVPLHDGDAITVGSVHFVFHGEPSTGTQEIKPATKISMIARAEPFPGGESGNPAKRFQYREGDILPNGEKILEPLEVDESAELYLTSSGRETVHLLKIWEELPQDSTAGKELKKAVGNLPKQTGILPVLGCGSLEDGACFLISEYHEVPSYAKMISMLSPISQIRALALIYSVVMILAEGYRQGIFHGHLKPSKILYAPQEGNYLAEMGLSAWYERFFPEQAGRPGWYTAPETMAGHSVWQSDQYALGIMLFQLLTGVLPFWADNRKKLADLHRNAVMPLPQERNPQITAIPAVNAILVRMTMKTPSERYENWENLLKDMEKANSILKKQESKSA